MTVIALALLAGSSWTLGRLALYSSSWPELRRYEHFFHAPRTEHTTFFEILP